MRTTNEEKFGIVSPPEYQCPRIDGIIRELDTLTHDPAKFSVIFESLEKLRNDITHLREWGLQWKKQTLKLSENV